MAINFPASPNLNDTFISGGVTYTWDGTVWVSSGPAAFVQKSGDTMTGDLTVPSLNGGQLSGFRNQIINGDFRIWERGTSILLTNSSYTADRWFGGAALDRVAIAYSGVGGFAQEASITPGTSLGGITQCIELSQDGHPSQFTPGSTWTLSFYSNRSTNDAAGAFCDSVNSFSAGTATAIFSGTPTLIPGETQRYSLTFTFPSPLSIDSTNKCFAVRISAGTTGQIRLTGVQLEPGPVATLFEHRPISTELALCQRYYIKLGDVFGVASRPVSGSLRIGQVAFPVTMRAKPTITGNTTYSPDYSNSTATLMKFTTSGVSDSSDHLVTNITADAEL